MKIESEQSFQADTTLWEMTSSRCSGITVGMQVVWWMEIKRTVENKKAETSFTWP